MKKTAEKKITVITGERGAGKTRYCALEEINARSRQLTVAGVLCPSLFQNGKKVGFFIRNLETGDQRLGGSTILKPEVSFEFGHWQMDSESFSWANEFLADIRKCGLLIIDELGPLEFSHQKGFLSAFETLRSADYQKALVVIRPDLVPAFKTMGFDFDTREII